MKNNSKMDIKIDRVDESELTQEEIDEQNYQTCLRYIEIARYMKKYQDQDRYYHRALTNLKPATAHRPELKPLYNELNRTKFNIRATGKIDAYKEACMIRDTAKTPDDLQLAQRLFAEIHKYEENHPLNKKWTTPEVYEEAIKCDDSEAQIANCERMKEEMSKKQMHRSLILDIIVIAALIACLFFTRTTAFRSVLGQVYVVMGDYEHAWQAYKNVYDHNESKSAYDNYCKYCYKAAKSAEKDGDLDTARVDYKKVAKENYEDSRQALADYEKKVISSAAVGDMVNFADINWIVLEREGDQVTMIKDKALGAMAFQEGGGDVTWATSSMRTYLNGEFCTENIYDEEKAMMVEQHLTNEDNSVYGTDGGEDTDDYVYLLSASEVEKYQNQLCNTQNCWWTRTPGATSTSMAFTYTDKSVIYAGTDASIDEIRVKPVIVVNTK